MANIQKTNSIIINECQKGNPLIQYIRNVPYEFGKTVGDYEVGRTTCVLFLSVRYHKLHPNYIYERIKELGKQFKLRILLLLVDSSDHVKVIRELTRVSLVLDFCLLLGWSNEEVARYLETFKAFEHKPIDALKSKTGDSVLERISSVLTQIKPINKTDVLTLATNFKTVADIIQANDKDLLMCPGFGNQKAFRFVETMEATIDPNLFKEK